MTFRDFVADFAADFAAAMDDTVTVRTNAQGKGTYNPATRTYDGTPTVVAAGIAALVRPRAAADVEYGEDQQVLVDYDVLMPPDTTGLLPGQQVTVDAVGTPTAAPELVGATMTVHAVLADTFNARLIVECKLNRGGGA